MATPKNMLLSHPEGDPASFCVTQLHAQVHPMDGLFVEGFATMVLMMIASAVWDRRNEHNTDSTALKFGMAVTCLATVFGPYTGCSMNPARSFGPAIWNNNWKNHWIYWVGPILGSVSGAFLYKTIFGIKSDKERSQVPEAVALNHVDGEKPEV